MLRRVAMEGIELPRLYVAETKADVELAKESGIPYVKWTRGMDTLIKELLRPTLEHMFPGINWNKVLGRRRKFKTEVEIVSGGKIETGTDYTKTKYDSGEVLKEQLKYDEHLSKDYHPLYAEDEEEYSETADIAEDVREFGGNPTGGHFVERMRIEDYIGDLSSKVNIEVLQKLNLLPSFIGDIADCIKVNLSNNMRWTEGYNKKLGVPVGRFGASSTLPNLIILDISGSIPRGISATMLTLIDTMRSSINADLIITSSNSVYYPAGCELPSPQTLRNYFGYGNEATEFYAILRDHVAGRKWGHVICFGDNDCPELYTRRYREDADKFPRMTGTEVKAVHHYHTGERTRLTEKPMTGYAKWVHKVSPQVEEHYDQSWCSIMYD